MRRLLLLVLFAGGCFSERYTPCALSCTTPGGDECPGDFVCGQDLTCHAAGDSCSSSMIDAGGPAIDASPPVSPGEPILATQVSVGRTHVCAVDGGGVTWCWGDDDHLQLGRPTEPTQSLARRSAAATGSVFAQLASGDGFTCGREGSPSFRILCWGRNDLGQLGQAGSDSAEARMITLGGNPVLPSTISAGADHACGFTASSVVCWGDNRRGALDGNPGTGNGPTAVQHFGLGVAGDGWTCVPEEPQKVFCWGDGSDGTFGQATGPGQVLAFPELSTRQFSGVFGGGRTVILPHGAASQPPDRTSALGPLGPGELPDVVAGEAAASHHAACLLHGSPLTSLRCWDDGTTQISSARTLATSSLIAGAYKHVSVGEHVACAIMAIGGEAGPVVCWGTNEHGMFGTGEADGITRSAPDPNRQVLRAAADN